MTILVFRKKISCLVKSIILFRLESVVGPILLSVEVHAFILIIKVNRKDEEVLVPTLFTVRPK